MATLWITEYSNWVSDPSGDAVVFGSPLATQRFTPGAETKSAVFQFATKFVRLTLAETPSVANSAGGAAFLFGLSPTVTASTGERLLPNQPLVFGVPQPSCVISFISVAPSA